MLEEGPLILGINEGAEVLKEVYDKFDEIKLGESRYSIMERGVILRSEEFGCSQKIQSYRFATPWIALNQKNYDKYRRASREERRDLLRGILVGNILSASKGLGYVAKEHIRLEFGEITEEICQLKDKKVTGIRGEFTTNFEIPELLGLGKSVSRGFGTVARLR